MNTSGNQLIRGTSRQGDFVLAGQTVAEQDGFRNVSRTWYEKTSPVTNEIERLRATRDEREAISVRIKDLQPDFCGEQFLLRFGERTFVPDVYAGGQLGSFMDIGSDYPRRLLSGGRAGNAEALALAFAHAWPARDRSDRVFLHVQGGDRLRGITTERQMSVRNLWYLQVVNRALPGSRLSHWRGDDYTLFGNVLIPDTIRAESDSEYGAMISLSNCEIGKRRLSQTPSLFRAICMNGCIWGQAKGQTFTLNRRGFVDLAAVEKSLIDNIRAQIPLALEGLKQLLNTRTFQTKTSMKALLAQVCKEQRIPKAQASSVLQAWWVERRETPDLARTLFAVVNSITRAGQTQDNSNWLKFDALGGRLARMSADEWSGLTARAARLKSTEVDAAYARWSPESTPEIAT